jgi:hypothetical protein
LSGKKYSVEFITAINSRTCQITLLNASLFQSQKLISFISYPPTRVIPEQECCYDDTQGITQGASLLFTIWINFHIWNICCLFTWLWLFLSKKHICNNRNALTGMTLATGAPSSDQATRQLIVS